MSTGVWRHDFGVMNMMDSFKIFSSKSTTDDVGSFIWHNVLCCSESNCKLLNIKWPSKKKKILSSD